MPVARVVGMETEFGILNPHDPKANVLALCAQIVEAYGAAGSASRPGKPVPWDYKGENPLNDARGYKIRRSEAHPSLLTDDPNRPAPSGEDSPAAAAMAGWGQVRRPSAMELKLPKAPNAVLTNGARFYVDHAHPEYSAPEVNSPREAVLWDRAGEYIAREAMDLCAVQGVPAVLYKNNLDGKGSAYGTHENYLMDREVPFADIVSVLTPFFVTRPIICGAGRVGIGKRSEESGFQISQRADYVENDIGIETTFNRPIINTRDEAHADEMQYRRLHVINGDANQFDVSNLLKVGTTSLVIWLIEQLHLAPVELRHRYASKLEKVRLAEPVSATQAVSQDLSCAAPLEMANGGRMSSADIQQVYLDLLREAHADLAKSDEETSQVLTLWQEVLDALREDVTKAAQRVEWVAKWQMLEQLRARSGVTWGNDKLRAFDLQWHDLRPERSIVNRLDQAGRVERLFTPAQVLHAVTHAPETTRAYLRGELIRRFPRAVTAAAWEAITLDIPGREHLLRMPLQHPTRATKALVGDILERSDSIGEFVAQLA